MNIDDRNIRTFATRENLIKKLVALGFDGDRHLIVCNSAGRFTAIFPQSNIRDGDLLRYSYHGFMTLG